MVKEICFFDKITEESGSRLIDQCVGENEVILHLSCGGGHPIIALAFYNFIRHKKINLTVNVLGDCFSSAILLLLAGKKRIASQNAFFLLHMLQRTYEGKNFKAEHLKDELKDMQKEEKRLQSIIAQALGKSVEELTAIFEAEKTLSAQEALNLGLLTEEPY